MKHCLGVLRLASGARNGTLFNLEGIRRQAERQIARGYSSAGRAPALQAGGRRFDPDYLHQENTFAWARSSAG